MNIIVYPLVLVLLPIVFAGYSATDNENIQRYLKSISASGYNKKLAPVTGSDAVKVVVSAHLLNIYKVDDSNMDFTADLYFRQQWKDSRLKFNDDLKANLKDGVILRDVSEFWTPDLFFVEERQGTLHQIMHPNMFFKVYPNGETLFSSRLTITFSCPMDLHYYPHDSQQCNIDVDSYAFQKEQISLSWVEPYNSPLSYSKNLQILDFNLINAVPTAHDTMLSIGNYSNLHMELTFKRKVGYFTVRLYVPSIILVLMTSMSFWISPEQRCLRLALLLVFLYLMVSISSSVNSVIPKTSYIKAIDVWIGFCQSLVFAAFLEFIAVGVISGRKSEESSSENNGEIALTLAPEGKEHQLTDSPKSPLTKVIHMFDTRRGGENTLSLRIDSICRVVFPTVFVIFIVIYCAVSLSA